MNRVRVEVPEADGDTLTGAVTATGPVSRFVSSEPFRTTYSTDVEAVPDHVRPIPVLAQVCPVAWANGADVVVDTVDGRFLDALREIRTQYTRMYPEFMTGGSVHCPNPVRPAEPQAATAADGGEAGSGMLFTGGVDSTATYVRHREEDPTLISVRGWIIGLDEDERWSRTREYVRSFAAERGHDADFVESNALDALRMPLLQAHFEPHLEGAWYSAVGHGLGLLGLCAPLAAVRGWDSLYIAASHTPEWPRPWGSHPDIDDEVAWTGTECSHDGYELSRQEKIERIATYVESESQDVPIRTCIYDDGAGNCSDCEKCYRTILGLLIAGLDPNDHGYECDGETLARLRERLKNEAWDMSSHTRYHWEVLQRASREADVDERFGGPRFQEWFDEQDLGAYPESTSRSTGRRLVQFAARNTPTPVFTTLYPLYSRVANGA